MRPSHFRYAALARAGRQHRNRSMEDAPTLIGDYPEDCLPAG